MRTVATAALLVVMPLSASGFDDVIPARDAITWKRTEPYLRIGGRQAFVFGRNPTGWRTEQFDPLLKWAHDSGERILRIHITCGMTPKSPAGTIDEKWAGKWEKVFDQAAKQGLYVLPVLGAWGQWNDGSDGKRWHYWDRNMYNAKLGGPAKSPSELFAETRCQQLWLEWLAQMVRRWRNRPNIVAWELFSELDLVTGATEKTAFKFVQRASSAVRKMDPAGRPVTASLSGIQEWPSLFSDDAIDLIQVHPYANHHKYRGQLDRMIIESVRARTKRYKKPVLIGESGFDGGPPHGTLDMAARAETGLRHAIWAAVVSGSMNGRMLWWGDGYDQYQKPDPELRKRYALLAKPAARFIRNIDWSDFKSIQVKSSPQLCGAAIGQKERVVAWFRDAQCIGPDWPTRHLTGQRVTLSVPGQTNHWRVAVYDPVTLRIVDKGEVNREGGSLHVELPTVEDAIVLELTRDETRK
ncbi:MAG TPA: cellulase family glycosylhydrolase [Thermoguttaceae bacterium]|nr:cellulase family glycosylhydrolase [Thermoguttaceae bacterium]